MSEQLFIFCLFCELQLVGLSSNFENRFGRGVCVGVALIQLFQEEVHQRKQCFAFEVRWDEMT